VQRFELALEKQGFQQAGATEDPGDSICTRVRATGADARGTSVVVPPVASCWPTVADRGCPPSIGAAEEGTRGGGGAGGDEIEPRGATGSKRSWEVCPHGALEMAGGCAGAAGGSGEDHVWFEDRWMVASLCDE
jgi:hypothetical protein